MTLPPRSLDQFGTDELRRELERRREKLRVDNRIGSQRSESVGSYIDHTGRHRQISLGMRFGRGMTSELHAQQFSSKMEYINPFEREASTSASDAPFDVSCAPDPRWRVNPATGRTERKQ